MIAVTLEFHPTAEQLPDDDISVVMLFADGEFELGFHDSGTWRQHDQCAIPADDNPVAWAHLPDPTPILAAAKSAKSAKSADKKAAAFL